MASTVRYKQLKLDFSSTPDLAAPLLKKAILASLQFLFLLVTRLTFLCNFAPGASITGLDLQRWSTSLTRLKMRGQQAARMALFADLGSDEWCAEFQLETAMLTFKQCLNNCLRVVLEKTTFPPDLAKQVRSCFLVGQSAMSGRDPASGQ
ncbi:hypothetical protein WJX82_001110 [Trebouxia sp. C0006]